MTFDHISGPFSWQRHANKIGSYEVSSKGDTNFSAFHAKMPDGRSIEHHYQCDIKQYDPGGTNWRLGKGKAPLDPNTDLLHEYVKLWAIWATHNHSKLTNLYNTLTKHNIYILTDTYATTPVNQANALSIILNAYHMSIQCAHDG